MTQKIGLKPISDGNSRILILGALPGDESLKFKKYYAHSRNQFWRIMSLVYGQDIDSNYDSRLCFLSSKRIALWDALKSANRRRSLDLNIRDEIPNDFSVLFEKSPQIEAIGFNGRKAEYLFMKYCMPLIDSRVMEMKVLPSTSPTPGKYVKSFDEKVVDWKDFLLSFSNFSRTDDN